MCVACCEDGIGLHRDVSGVDVVFGEASSGTYFSLMQLLQTPT